MRIVIVEDEVQTREGLSRLIERIDPRYRVVGSAANGQKGLELIYDKRPDVVITDIRMPQMDGLEMIESLARLNVTPKYIVISAFSEFSYARRAMSFGVSEYLLKPISMMELKQAMEKLECSFNRSGCTRTSKRWSRPSQQWCWGRMEPIRKL